MARGGKRNGAGRPKGSGQIAKSADKTDLASKIREHTDQIIAILLTILKSSGSDSARVQAASMLLDRGYGKVPLADKQEPPQNDLAQALAEINQSRSSAPIKSMQSDEY